MAHPFSNRPGFANLSDDLFGFAQSSPASKVAIERARNISADIGSATTSGVWADYAQHYGPDIDRLRSDVSVGDLIQTLFASHLTHGFLHGRLVSEKLASSHASRMHIGAIIMDRFYRLAEAVGATSVKSAEHNQTSIEIGDLDSILEDIENRVGFDLTPPGIAGGLFGLKLSKGIYSERHFDAVYIVWRLTNIVQKGTHICEIGGGAGHLCYYAVRAGLKCTLIDLPGAGIVQSLLLDTAFPGAVQLVRNDGIDALDFRTFDIVVNADSLPEMPVDTAQEYIDRAAQCGRLLSVNQEVWARVRDQARTAGFSLAYRFPYWLRTGYVEELFTREPHTSQST